MLITIFVLLVVFQVKHYVVDYIWQLSNPDSLKKFDRSGWEWPLFKHANEHAVASVLISLVTIYAYGVPLNDDVIIFLIAIYFFDGIIHFTMDRIKASPYIWGKYTYPDKRYFKALGFDQSVHHLTHYAIILLLVLFLTRG